MKYTTIYTQSSRAGKLGEIQMIDNDFNVIDSFPSSVKLNDLLNIAKETEEYKEFMWNLLKKQVI